MNSLISLTMRELKKWYRRKIAMIFTFITPIFWLGLFGKSINFYKMFNIPPELSPQFIQLVQGMIDKMIITIFGTKDYFSFLATGMFSVFILFSSMFGGISIIFDRRLGYLNRLLVSPVRREWILLSRVLANIIKSVAQFTVLLILALALGLNLKQDFGLIDIISIYFVLGILALIFSNIFISISLKIEEHDTAIAIVNLLNLPLMFASNSLFPRGQMPEWLQAIAQVNPLTHSNILVRSIVIGVQTTQFMGSLIYLTILGTITTILGLIASRKLLQHL